MVVLYNGVYKEHDITSVHSWDSILKGVEQRRSYLGLRIGDFEVAFVDYDWGTRSTVNRVRCVNCGHEKDVADLGAFRRGKGEGRLCKCRYKKEERTPRKKPEEYIGEVHNGFRVVGWEQGKGYRTECAVCGNQKWRPLNRILDGSVSCNHKKVNDYSDPKYIGMKVGYLTAIERLGRKYRFRCDCGTETILRPGDVFKQRAIVSCGREECEYRRKSLTDGQDIRKQGIGFEFECADVMKSQGFAVEMLPSSGDYGVDFFAMVDGERVAFQCKKLKTSSVVHAVQEVYAGGRYYDCCKFVVVSPSGFSYPAELMGAKLGVQLETSLQNFRLKALEENRIETNKTKSYSGHALLWEIDGVVKPTQEWCREYGVERSTVVRRVEKKGLSLKDALTAPAYRRTTITIDGETKSKLDWCDQYGISTQLYDYRVKYSGLSPLEALTKPKETRTRKAE